jgi:16S rRNA (adenine1518-N6/adenine1519-N6)-dimethyltransferase
VKRAKKMVAIEFDARMESLLAMSTPGCEVIIGDAMQVDLAAVLKTLPEPRALVSNLPYYITGPLLERFAQVRSEYSVSVLMMQKEVGQKIIALPSDRARGSLSVHLQSQFKITHVVNASAGCFLPPPKVDSIVLKFVPRTDQFPIHFSRVVKAGFTQNRKTLINNLSATFRQTKADIESILSECGLPITSRAFELCESDWIRLATEIEKQPWIESVANNSKK